MKIPVVEHCCCGFLSNREGSLLIAILNLLGYCSSLAMNAADLGGGRFNRPDFHDYVSEKTYTCLLVSILVIFLVFIVFDCLLIHGVRKWKRKLMIPWLCLEFVALVAGLILFLVSFVAFTVLLVSQMNGVLLTVVIVMAVGFFILYSVGVHFFLVVYSYYKELENLEQSGGDEYVQRKQGNVPAGSIPFQARTSEA
ncbi:unnamed protein product [Darwinula stevensoni]|uniref:DUF7027 domain-containing protein n=1 Tax=Darwinula stevensoni TaxID=69355 RepID=A0A7R8X858_9CRUS|nr:unnamed protein product [Darwinula stevensoni]CAG0889764.1 unnamed protein product [Darwinula stevensoni]